MTTALYLNCGELKWGAFCKCKRCRVSTCGDLRVNLVISDHHFFERTLDGSGSVIKKIDLACQDPQLAYWVFISYVSEHHPCILTADLPPELKTKVEDIMRDLVLPKVTVCRSTMYRRASW